MLTKKNIIKLYYQKKYNEIIFNKKNIIDYHVNLKSYDHQKL